MSATRSTGKILATLLLGAALPLAMTACGDEKEAPTASSATEVAPPSDRDVPTVAGPNPNEITPASSAAETEETTEAQGRPCGTARGPEGALQVRIVAGSADCGTVKKVADEYGPLMYKGGEQKVDGWTCVPSAQGSGGELSRCTKGDDAFALVLEN